MNVHYSRPGHFEEMFSPGEPAVNHVANPTAPNPLYTKIDDLIARGRAAGATDEDFHTALVVAEDTVKAILADRAKVS